MYRAGRARSRRGRTALRERAPRLTPSEWLAACPERTDRGTRSAPASTRQLLRQVLAELARGDAVLLERVAVPHRHRLILRGLAVDRDPVRCARFVLAAVAPADRSAVVVKDLEVAPQVVVNPVRELRHPVL